MVLPDLAAGLLQKTRDLEIKKSWIHIVTIYGIVTVLSIFGGWITGYLDQSAGGPSLARARPGMFMFACAPCLFLAHETE